MKYIKLISVLAAFTLGTLVSRGAAIVNGGFESGLAGWTVVDNGDLVLLSGSTPYGNNFLEIGGFGGSVSNSIKQVLTGMTVGGSYTLGFSIASQWAGGSGAQVMVSTTGTTALPDVFTAPDVGSWGAWQSYTYDFVANSTTVGIQFTQVTNGFDDVGIDNISLTEHSAGVPDGGSTLAILGLALAGLVTVRRRVA